jgi:hypothetical protein
MPAPSNFDEQLEASLRRIAGALQQNRSQYAAIVDRIVAATNAEVADRLDAKTQRVAARIAERHERRMEEWQRRFERREERRQRGRDREKHGDPGEFPRGIVFAVIAIVCAMLALREPPLFWMVFVALGFGMSAVQAFTRALTRGQSSRQAEAETTEAAGDATPAREPAATNAATTVPPLPPVPPVTEPPDPKVVRIQTLCDKLLAELESGPPIVREVVTEPQTTIGGLRQACLETARRERELRGVLAAQDEAGLMAERDALAARLSTEKDAIVRERLGQALRALQEQLEHRAELATAATRLEAENTRILYTLENLHMQLLRARSTDIGAPELGGKLRESLRELGTQIDAVAEALEIASAPASIDVGASTAAPSPATAAPVGPAASSDERERAERAAAARRAEQARHANKV